MERLLPPWLSAQVRLLNQTMVDRGAARIVLDAWRETCKAVVGSPGTFTGRDKEGRVIQLLRDQIVLASRGRSTNPDLQCRHGSWFIDLAWRPEGECIAVEGKFKVLSDGAVPDNRKAAFFDLFKLEQCVDSGAFTSGMFLWLTDQPDYLRQARGDSADFSTHLGRTYQAGTLLRAARSRNVMPLPLVLNRGYAFEWEPVGSGGFNSLALFVD